MQHFYIINFDRELDFVSAAGKEFVKDEYSKRGLADVDVIIPAIPCCQPDKFRAPELPEWMEVKTKKALPICKCEPVTTPKVEKVVTKKEKAVKPIPLERYLPQHIAEVLHVKFYLYSDAPVDVFQQHLRKWGDTSVAKTSATFIDYLHKHTNYKAFTVQQYKNYLRHG